MEDGKFHPHNQTKGVRKSRDQQAKSQGVKIRKARTITTSKLKDIDIRREFWGFHSENGKIVGLDLGNLTNAGFFWNGDGESIDHFMVMMAGFQDTNEFVKDMDEAGITLDMLKPMMLKNLSGKLVDNENDDGMYALSGGDTIWRFGDLPEVDLQSEFSGWDYFDDGSEFTQKEIEIIEDRFWNHFDDIGYEDFLKEKGEEWRDNFRKMIKDARSLEDLIGELAGEGRQYDRWEIYDELRRPKIDEAIHKSIKELQKEGKLRKK